METTQKQKTKCDICGKLYKSGWLTSTMGVLEPDCNCEMKKLEDEQTRLATPPIDKILYEAGVPGRALRYSFETFDTFIKGIKRNGPATRDKYMDILLRVKYWATREFPGTLLLAGDTGVGKTGLAAAALRFFAQDEKLPIKYFYAYDLLTRGVNFDTRESTLAVALKPKAMVIDEIGIQLRTEAAIGFLERVMVGRHEDGKITIIITNEQPDTFWGIAGDRIRDRIIYAGDMIAFTGSSLRVSERR